MRSFLVLALAAVNAAAGQSHTSALEMQGNVAFVKASIGDSGRLDMVLDSGTVHTTLDEAAARKLGLDLSMKAQSSGAKGMQEISVIKDQTLRFCGVDTVEPLMVAYPLDFVSERIGRHVDGIIGVELLRKYVVEVDYPERQVRVTAAEDFTYAGAGEVLPVTYDRRLPLVTGSVGRDPIPARFQVDSGGAAAHVMFWKVFIEKHELAAGTRGLLFSTAIRTMRSCGKSKLTLNRFRKPLPRLAEQPAGR